MQLAGQPANWSTPGAYPVIEGVHRIVLPLPLRGLAAVNVYVLRGTDGLVLVDSGWASDTSLAALKDGLAQLGYDLQDIDLFVVTHSHWDHYSQAVRVRSITGASLAIGAGEQLGISACGREGGSSSAQVELLRAAGAPELAEAVARRQPHDFEIVEPADRWLREGDIIKVHGGQLEIEESPGHTRGHITVHYRAGGVVFTGDHLLPHITPAIGLDRVPQPGPLRAYLASLQRSAGDMDAVMLPAHGPLGGSTRRRAAELISHHEHRLQEILGQLRSGRSTAFEIASALVWTSKKRQLAELELVHRMTAVLEVGAHLDVLIDRGAAGFVMRADVRHVTAA